MGVLKTTILSFIFIFLFHNLYLFFKNNLTVPKVKDLVATNDEKYSDILSAMNSEPEEIINTPTQNIDPDAMKNELKNYIKNISINNSSPNDTTPIV
jgi:glutathionyl-hydroquinone reductase